MSYSNNPTESGAPVVDITADFIRAVGEKKYEKLKKILRYLRNKNATNPILYGEALRDLYLGQHVPDTYHFRTDKKIEVSSFARNHLTYVFSIRGTTRGKDILRREPLIASVPINGIAMNLLGTVVAHPLFQGHAKGLIYKPSDDLTKAQRDEAFKRFFAAAEIYPDLKLVG